jgi:osmoprotectant transport system ATP-binding protein
LIEVRNLTKIFTQGNVKAVNNVNFKLNQGEIGCIIGTSGCGKTTTLKMINRLIEPTEGEIIVSEQSFKDSDAVKWRRKIGYVIQKAGLLPHLTIKDNISLLSKILKKPKSEINSRVKELMETINLPFEKYKDFYPKELSGGQQQRVGIARALMEDPPVMLMDEPFGALDPITRESLHEEFIELNRKLKKTILMVTHDMNEAFKLGDKIILMNKGEIVQMGSKLELIENPKNEFVEEFVKGHGHD